MKYRFVLDKQRTTVVNEIVVVPDVLTLELGGRGDHELTLDMDVNLIPGNSQNPPCSQDHSERSRSVKWHRPMPKIGP